MPKIIWDKLGDRFYETGVDQGVLYVMDNAGLYGAGVAWNGLTGVTESPTGGEATPQYADNIKYLNLISAEDYGATIEAFTYPKEFGVCDGSKGITGKPGLELLQQERSTFGFSYRTKIGNDIQGDSKGYKIHLVYGCKATPSDKAYTTINESPEAMTFSWEVTTTPVVVAASGFKPTSHLIINSVDLPPAKLVALEKLIYGDAAVAAALPTPDAIITLISAA